MSNFAGEIKKASIAVLIQNLRINFLKFKKMKRNRNPTNKSVMKRYTTLDSSIGSRLLLDRSSFGSRSVLVRSSIGSRSSFVYPSFILRSSFVRESKNNRRWIEEVSEVHLRQYGGKTEAKRRCIETLRGSHEKGNPNKTLFFNHLNPNYYGKTYWNYFQTQRFCR